MESLCLIFFTYLVGFTSIVVSNGVDTLAPSQFLTINDTLVSTGKSFELGFFSPKTSYVWYLGIWYKDFPDIVVWVANRENPLVDSFGAFSISINGNLTLLNRKNDTIWFSDSSSVAENPVAQLLDSGNFVVRDKDAKNTGEYVWQSFDFPSDTQLAGMKLGWDLEAGVNRFLTSWRNASDPSPGEFTYRIDNLGLPQFVLRNGSEKTFRSGPWNGIRFSGVPSSSSPILRPVFIFNSSDLYYMYEASDNSVITMSRLDEMGLPQRLVLNKGSSDWSVMYTVKNDQCDDYGHCGANGVCRISQSPVCQCLKGFIPKSSEEWEVLNWRSGCVRKSQLGCHQEVGFLKLENLKLPDLLDFKLNNSLNLKECEEECLKNCSCTAYANLYISNGGSGCLMWFGDLIDIREIIDEDGQQDIYVRMLATELESKGVVSNRTNKRLVLGVVISTVLVALLVLACFCLIWRKRREKRRPKVSEEDLELPLFDFLTIATATNNFSYANKLGEGGFGPVYKGNLLMQQEIAVKRLSHTSGQGLDEFRNEVTMIAKLQHRNLVKLLGYCIEGEERMLIYEYMPNKSLDGFIFDKDRRVMLTWQKRFEIIMGIARGLLYLHQDSRVRIIHRDLKTSNILLDSELNPKISDFGIARIFGGNQTEAKTKKVIGTYGYMSPEYAIDGKFSVKSDVFSFGVLLLEIVSGKRNRGFKHPDHNHNLLGHAWLLWNENKALELMEQCLKDSNDESEVLRCIQVGLLCIQKLPNDRPAMPSVVLMLSTEGATLPQPKQPGFFIERGSEDVDTSIGNDSSGTENVLTITVMEAR